MDFDSTILPHEIADGRDYRRVIGMKTDKLNTDFMDIQAIALAATMGNDCKRREIIMVTRSFKEHLDEVEAELCERESVRHG